MFCVAQDRGATLWSRLNQLREGSGLKQAEDEGRRCVRSYRPVVAAILRQWSRYPDVGIVAQKGIQLHVAQGEVLRWRVGQHGGGNMAGILSSELDTPVDENRTDESW